MITILAKTLNFSIELHIFKHFRNNEKATCIKIQNLNRNEPKRKKKKKKKKCSD